MKQLFLQSVNIHEHTEERDNIIYTKNKQGELEVDLFNGWYDDYNDPSVIEEYKEMNEKTGFNGFDYEDEINQHKSKVEVIISNIDGFRKYNINSDCIVSHKEARTSIEETRPFIVAKRGKKLGIAEEIDTIYRSLPKMKITNKSCQRIGFVQADERAKTFELKNRTKDKFRGILNDEFMIAKKKGFNQKKIGYIPLKESTATKDLYVEVTTDRGYKWLAVILIILCILVGVISFGGLSDWNFDTRGLTLYKTAETVDYKASEIAISLNATPVLRDGMININLTSEKQEGIDFIAYLYDENDTLLYESDRLHAGDSISKIQIYNDISLGRHNCKIICESYRADNYLGTIKSDIVLEVEE